MRRGGRAARPRRRAPPWVGALVTSPQELVDYETLGDRLSEVRHSPGPLRAIATAARLSPALLRSSSSGRQVAQSKPPLITRFNSTTEREIMSSNLTRPNTPQQHEIVTQLVERWKLDP